jgi:hypothetical protein
VFLIQFDFSDPLETIFGRDIDLSHLPWGYADCDDLIGINFLFSGSKRKLGNENSSMLTINAESDVRSLLFSCLGDGCEISVEELPGVFTGKDEYSTLDTFESEISVGVVLGNLFLVAFWIVLVVGIVCSV